MNFPIRKVSLIMNYEAKELHSPFPKRGKMRILAYINNSADQSYDYLVFFVSKDLGGINKKSVKKEKKKEKKLKLK